MELLAEARAIATRASTGHRELHSTVSKVGKAIDKVGTLGGNQPNACAAGD